MTRVPGTLVLFDIWRDGRVLLARADRRREVMSLYAGETKERDLSWLDYSYPADLSADGKTVLFDEEGIGGGVQYGDAQELTYAVYIRNTDGSPAIRLGEGGATPSLPTEMGDRSDAGLARTTSALAHRGRRNPAAYQRHHQPPMGALVPRRQALRLLGKRTGARRAPLCAGYFRRQTKTDFSGRGRRHSISRFRPIASWSSASAPIRKDISTPRREATRDSLTAWNREIPINWSQDGRSIYLYRTGEVPAKVYRLELATGKKTVWKQIVPLDPTGVSTIGPILMTPDGKTYVYGFHRTLGDLYLVEGLK